MNSHRAERARARLAVTAEITRIYGAVENMTLDIVIAVGKVESISDISTLRAIAFLLANAEARQKGAK